MSQVFSFKKVDVDASIERHLEALGFDTVGKYRIWCHQQGLSISLEKTTAELEAEQALAQTLHGGRTLSRHHTPGRTELIRRIGAGDLDERAAKTPIVQQILTAFSAQGDDGDRRQQLTELLIVVEKFGDMFNDKVAFPYLGDSPGNNFISGLGQLARHHRDWLRSPEEWVPDSHYHRSQFRALARHLLAQYEVPPFMDAVWFMGDVPEAHQQQEWFKGIGSGQNIRRLADVPLNLTKRMAHMLLSAPRNWTVVQAMRWAQVRGMGGDNSMARAVCHTRLGTSLEHENFWESVVLFLSNQAMLESSYVGPIVDYIQHQKFVPQQDVQPGGQVVQRPPAQPNFSMKSRSIAKLMRQVEEWHDTLTSLDSVAYQEWEASGVRDFEHEEEDAVMEEVLHWSIHELTTSWELAAEGQAMHHCVSSYAGQCVSGKISVWSLQAMDSEDKVKRVLTIAMDNKKKTVTQARGKYNMLPFDKKRNPKQSHMGQEYFYLLKESPRIMALWTGREGLRNAS